MMKARSTLRRGTSREAQTSLNLAGGVDSAERAVFPTLNRAVDRSRVN
jgi:hypothetical protein